MQPLGEGAGFPRARLDERLNELGEILALGFFAEGHTGHTGSGEKIGETALRRGGLQGDPVQQELRAGGPQEQPGIALGGLDRLGELPPGGVELVGRPGMVHAVHPGILQKDVERPYKSPRVGGE